MSTMLIGFGVVGGFMIWKFLLQPIMNEDKPIKPDKNYKTISEQMEEAVNTSVDF